MFHVYIIESAKNEKWYYGYSENLEQRLIDHNTNSSKFTRFKGPWKLIFSQAFKNKSEALRFEKYLKKLKNKKYISDNIINYSG